MPAHSHMLIHRSMCMPAHRFSGHIIYTTPKLCANDIWKGFCTLMHKVLGPGGQLKGSWRYSVENRKFSVELSLAQIRFSSKVTLMEAKVAVALVWTEFGMPDLSQTGIGISGRLEVKRDHGEPLYFTGSIKVSIKGLTFTFTSAGMWRNLLGIKGLGLGGLYLSTTLGFVPPPAFVTMNALGEGPHDISYY